MANSTIRIALEQSSVCEGDEFIAHVYIDAPEAINAAQGILRYDPSQLTPIAVRYGDSFLRYWVTAPGLPTNAGSIEFTGGLPFPGFQGAGGKVMSVVFRADTADTEYRLTIERDAQVLLNDGEGTATDISFKDTSIAAIERSAAVCQAGPPITIEETDTVPPAPFDIIIDRTEKAFEGNYFAIYETTDAQSGISHYEVRETSQFISTPWQKTPSPYELGTQGGKVVLEVRAVDGAGNVRLSSTSEDLQPITGPMALEDIVLLVGVGVLAAILWAACRKKRE